MGWDGLGWVGMGWDGMGWDGMGWDGMGWDGMGWDGMGWDGMGWEGKGRDGKGRELTYHIVLTSHGLYVPVEDGDLAVELALEAQRKDSEQGAEAQEGTAAAVEDTGRLPRVGRQVGHAEVTAVDAAHLRRNLSTHNTQLVKEGEFTQLC